MRFRTLEIRWHDSKPISTCDFQPTPFKKARPPPGPSQDRTFASHAYRLATGGEDNHVRVWMVHPHLRPPDLFKESEQESAGVTKSSHAAQVPPPRPPRVEYLATLSRHSAAVNVVRFSPNGELIASAGDDGMIIIWALSAIPQTSTYGSDLTPEELQNEKEYWKPRTTFRCTTMQVYDLAWSPTGEYIIAGSTDNTARIFTVADGNCVQEIAEHTHYVQGVAWDPLNEYIATQSSDRSMHIYRLEFSNKTGMFEAAHAVGRNTRMRHRRRDRQHNRVRAFRSESVTSEAESEKEEGGIFTSAITPQLQDAAMVTPLTPASSTTTTSSMFPPPPYVDRAPSSRRSSFSSNAPGSPAAPYGAAAGSSRYGRSPSPMPPLPLPAIRTPPVRRPPSPSPIGIAGSNSTAGTGGGMWWTRMLYGDESFTNFFRRLTFSPDGGLLMTPAGQFEDPTVVVSEGGGNLKSAKVDNESVNNGTHAQPVRGRAGKQEQAPAPVDAQSMAGNMNAVSNSAMTEVEGAAMSTSENSTSSVYIYSRANFARPPVAQLPGHRRASIAVRFSPILYELRPGVIMPVDVAGTTASDDSTPKTSKDGIPPAPPHKHPQPIPGPGMTSPLMSPLEVSRRGRQSQPITPAASKPATPLLGPVGAGAMQVHTPTKISAGTGTTTGSVFALRYRMLFAVATTDAIAIYDTQQAGPVCMLTKLHYDEFTDLTWSPDGQCLMVSSRDGYCTLVTFDEILPAYHLQQHTIQLQSIADHHSVPLDYSYSSASSTTAASMIGLRQNRDVDCNLRKRSEPPLTPVSSVDGQSGLGVGQGSSCAVPGVDAGDESAQHHNQEPPKKKRRAALTRVADLGD